LSDLTESERAWSEPSILKESVEPSIVVHARHAKLMVDGFEDKNWALEHLNPHEFSSSSDWMQENLDKRNVGSAKRLIPAAL